MKKTRLITVGLSGACPRTKTRDNAIQVVTDGKTKHSGSLTNKKEVEKNEKQKKKHELLKYVMHGKLFNTFKFL
ncbi:MAG: hypothetical protein L3J83_12330 [Proteobacteria bacterium]|nr:hypothetical protein [Pseudomonadota bacterium]